MSLLFNHWITWCLILTYFIFSAFKVFVGGILPSINIALNIGLLVGIAIMHGREQLGIKKLAIFFALVFVISNAYENMSVMTGFPF